MNAGSQYLGVANSASLLLLLLLSHATMTSVFLCSNRRIANFLLLILRLVCQKRESEHVILGNQNVVSLYGYSNEEYYEKLYTQMTCDFM